MYAMAYTEPDYDAWESSIDQAILQKMNGADVVSYSMQGVTFTKSSLDDLLNVKERIRALRMRNEYGSVSVADNSGGSC